MIFNFSAWPKFKCTTVPIIRKEYGVVGAICINVDANYLTEEVMNDAQKVRNFFEIFCRTDMGGANATAPSPKAPPASSGLPQKLPKISPVTSSVIAK